MSSSLKLELKPNNQVLVTNLQTNESREVSLSLIQEASHDSLNMLIQYKYYELLLNTEAIWRIVKLSNIKAEVQKDSIPSIKSPKSTSLSLRLELIDHNQVLVTNLYTNESREVTLRFIQEAAHDSLPLLSQSKYYELIINAEKVWQRVQHFNIQTERIIEIGLEEKFRRAMTNDQWWKISDYDREMYQKALGSWANTYNSQANKPSFDKFVFVPTVGGAIAGALTYSTIGGMGIAAAGTAFGVGALGYTALGSIGGLAVYGINKAIS
ncbi:MAG: hypothetical protein AAGE84_31530 [Cyanobacteria bacterium P01_G01_bin.39]